MREKERHCWIEELNNEKVNCFAGYWDRFCLGSR